MDNTLAKQILDEWATKVITRDAVYTVNDIAKIDFSKNKNYKSSEYSENIVLWIAPPNSLRIEFEGTPEENRKHISRCESMAKGAGLDYCITEHDGAKSPYFNMFNLPMLTRSEMTTPYKKLICNMLLDKSSLVKLDETNLGKTLTPVIEHSHWKPKYNKARHKITSGINPLEHDNTRKPILLELKKEIEKVHKKNKERISNLKKSPQKWTEYFLLDYCCNNLLPKGQRHSVISKNLAILIAFREDKDSIIQQYLKAQQSSSNDMNSWVNGVLDETYTEVNALELRKYIETNNIPFEILEDEITKPSNLREEVLSLLLQKKGDEATELICQDILSKEHIHTLRDDECAEVWIYKDGIYIPHGKTYIKEYCRNLLKESFTSTLCNLIIAKIESDTYISPKKLFIEEDLDLVPVNNGILNIETLELIDFSPKYRFFVKLPVSYKPEADCPKIKKFLSEILKSDDDKDVLQELFGFLLLRDYKFEYAFMFTGTGRNGKGKTLELMKRFIGEQNCANIPLERIEKDNFSLCEFHHKLANLSADISKTALKNTGSFKSLTGHDMISAPRKFLTHVSFVNYAKMIFCANELPLTEDISDAFFDRWIMLDFEKQFLPKEEIFKHMNPAKYKIRDTKMIDKISIPEELEGLLVWSLKGLKRLKENNRFSYSTSTEQVKSKWLRKSSSIQAFIMDHVKFRYDNHITKSFFKDEYRKYCVKNEIKPVIDKEVKECLEKEGACSTQKYLDGERTYVWENIVFVGIEYQSKLTT